MTVQQPRSEEKPEEKEHPYSTGQQIIVIKDLSKRFVRKHKPHEKFKSHGKHEPDEAD